MSQHQNGRGALLTGGLAAILASTCCLGPLVLLTLGISGAWIGNLTVLEPFRPIFIGVAMVAWFFAYRHIFRAVGDCGPDAACAAPQAEIKTVTLAVSGMTCATCPITVKKALTIEALTKATTDAGYPSTATP